MGFLGLQGGYIELENFNVNKIFFWSICFMSFFSCFPKKKRTSGGYNEGSLAIYTDDSFRGVVEALAEAYTANYPDVRLTVKSVKEDLSFYDLISGKIKLIALSKTLSSEEIKEYERHTQLKFQKDYFAVDAVMFVVAKSSNITSLSVSEIKQKLLSNKKLFIFDGNNSSNINFMAEKIGVKPSRLSYAVINGNENLAEKLDVYPGKIGVISLNTLSRPYAEKPQKLRSKIRVLPVSVNGKEVVPEIQNIRSMKYPYSRRVYFLVNEGGFGIASGFRRFACTQKGQMVVEKEGLQPYYLYRRRVQMK
ncbi:MAG: phosphate ABC transporter substrate-binding protein [Bergeyella sp.]|nr:phosphate ABC transporter substrate-binding protein [Bergeyella sp.]